MSQAFTTPAVVLTASQLAQPVLAAAAPAYSRSAVTGVSLSSRSPPQQRRRQPACAHDSDWPWQLLLALSPLWSTARLGMVGWQLAQDAQQVRSRVMQIGHRPSRCDCRAAWVFAALGRKPGCPARRDVDAGCPAVRPAAWAARATAMRWPWRRTWRRLAWAALPWRRDPGRPGRRDAASADLATRAWRKRGHSRQRWPRK